MILKVFYNVNDSASLQFYDPLSFLAKTELLPKVIKYNLKCINATTDFQEISPKP